MNTTKIGNESEQAAVEYLDRMNFTILQRNWRTKWCEVDIVAQSADDVIHIIEVRYRRSVYSGSGFDSVNRTKQRQLIHAARRWQMKYAANEGIQIDVMSVTGTSKNWEIDYIPNAVGDG